jgi:hypothetical protein
MSECVKAAIAMSACSLVLLLATLALVGVH